MRCAICGAAVERMILRRHRETSHPDYVQWTNRLARLFITPRSPATMENKAGPSHCDFSIESRLFFRQQKNRRTKKPQPRLQ